MNYSLRPACLLIALVALLIAATPSLAVPPDRGGNSPTLSISDYQYAPSIMKDGSVYKMWWCGSPSDHIYYATASSPGGTWSTPQVVFGPTLDDDDFDGNSTCDPSVVKVGADYYMYYTGNPQSGDQDQYSSVGVAKSADGVNWTRLNGGLRILDVYDYPPYSYGTGQTSVIFLNGYFYMTRTDSSNPGGTDGQFVLRSTDPTFQGYVQELRSTGWHQLSSLPPTTTFDPIEHAVSVDWAYSQGLKKFIVNVNGIDGEYVSTRFYGQDLHLGETDTQVDVEGDYTEGPGLIRQPNGWAIDSASCDNLALDQYRPVGSASPSTWDLSYIGYDYDTGETACEPLRDISEPRVRDYDADGNSDVVVYRPSTGHWYTRDLATGFERSYDWGVSTDTPVSGDFDGDGLSDAAVFRGSTGRWYIKATTGQCPTGWTPSAWGCERWWGLSGDIPVAADFDGDKTTDASVWRPSDKYFYISLSGGGSCPSGYSSWYDGCRLQWGLAGDIPVPGDYDGDGLANAAIYRSGDWYVHGMANVASVGNSTDTPLPADLNGDGYTDFVVVRSSGGVLTWYWKTAWNASTSSTQFGNSGDVPFVGNFLGGDTQQRAVFRGSSGLMYIDDTNFSSAITFGLSGDLVPK